MKNIKKSIYNILRLSEKWTNTDMVYLAKGGSWITAGKIIGIITSACLAIAYAKFLSKDDYGLFKYVLSITSFFSIATLSGLNDSVARSVAMGYEGVVNKAIRLKLKFGVLGILAGAIVSIYYFVQGNPILGFCFLFAAIFSPTNDSLFIYGVYLNGKKLFRMNSIMNIIYQVIMAATIILSLVLSPSATHLILIYFLTGFLMNFIFNYYTYKKYPPNQKIDNEAISFGKHLSIMSVLGMLSSQIDKIIMWHFLGPAQLAIYSYATLPVDSFESFVIKSISPLALPKLSEQKRDVLKKTFPLKIFKFTLILVIPAVIYYFSSPFLYKLLFPEYIESIKYTQIYAIAFTLFPCRLFSTALLAHAQKKSLYIINTILPSGKLIIMSVFIFFWGINGAIASLLLNLAANYLLNYYYLKKM